MDWKEVFKVSAIVGIAIYLLQAILSFLSGEYVIMSAFLGPLATAFILNKKLKNSWNVLAGITITFLVIVIIAVLLDTLGIFSI